MIGKEIATSPPPALNRKGKWQERYDSLLEEFNADGLYIWQEEVFDSSEDAVCFIRAAYQYFGRHGLVLRTARRKEEPLKVWCQLRHHAYTQETNK